MCLTSIDPFNICSHTEQFANEFDKIWKQKAQFPGFFSLSGDFSDLSPCTLNA